MRFGHDVDADTRRVFQDPCGNEYWHDDTEAVWHENGTEQAAEIIAWRLFDRSMAMSRITRNTCHDLETGFRTRVGQAPLHGLRDLGAS